jgi:hypothetical protein
VISRTKATNSLDRLRRSLVRGKRSGKCRVRVGGSGMNRIDWRTIMFMLLISALVLI